MAAVLPDPSKPFGAQVPVVLLGCLVFGEARGESFEVKLAVAHVAVNRLRVHGFGVSLVAVCLQPNAFSCFSQRDPNRAKLLEPEKHEKPNVWADCYYAAALALGDSAEDPSRGAVFYHDVSIDSPPGDWGRVRPAAAIGRMRFYKAE
jgi:cell wall hydrolase